MVLEHTLDVCTMIIFILLLLWITSLSTIYVVMCKVYTDKGGIK